jgi:hypothetical protein
MRLWPLASIQTICALRRGIGLVESVRDETDQKRRVRLQREERGVGAGPEVLVQERAQQVGGEKRRVRAARAEVTASPVPRGSFCTER